MSRDMVSSGPNLSTPEPFLDFLGPEHLAQTGAKLDVAQFPATDAVTVTVSGAASAGATSVSVAALSGPIPNGTIIHFGADEFLKLNAAASAGATSLTVLALPQALEGGEVGTYAGTGLHTVPRATPVGRTLTERDAGTGYGPADAADDEIFLTAFDIPDVLATGYSGDVDLARHGTGVRENFIPGWTGLAGGLKTAIRARYECVRGAD